jgi:flagellar motor switch protein FliN/FliY
MPDITLESLAPLRDVPLTLSAELGRRGISGKQLMELQPGTVLELSTLAGENVSLFVEDVLLGAGEVLVMNNSLAVRVADLKDKTPMLAHDPKGTD